MTKQKKKVAGYLLPAKAKLCETLTMYQSLPEKGLYYTLNPSGKLTSVGLAGVPRGHSLPQSTQDLVCINLLSIQANQSQGSFQTSMTLTVFQRDGWLIETSAYSDSGEHRSKSKVSFAHWAQQCINSLTGA